MLKELLLTFFVFLSLLSFAQTINGNIVDDNNKPIIDVNVYQSETSVGTITNIDGYFSLNIKEGNSQLFIQCVGYKTQIIQLNANNMFKPFKLVMHEENVVLPEFKLMGNGEDPAYYIMRKAIAMAPYYMSQLSEYDCKVYLKGSFTITHMPWLIKKMMDDDDKKHFKIGKAYVTESINEIHFEYPNKIKQNLIAIRSSELEAPSSAMPMVLNNLYNSDAYGMSSPIGPSSFSTYKYKLIGSFKENGETINKIQITAKGGREKGVFNGYLYIIDNRWNLHSVDLNMKVPMAEMNMKHTYGFIENGVWMPISISLNIKGGLMGVEGKGSYIASFSKYKVVKNPKLDHSILAKINGDVANLNSLLANKKAKKTDESKSISKNKEKIDKILEKDEMTNADMRSLNRLMKKETLKKQEPKALELKERKPLSKLKIKNDSLYWAGIRPIELNNDEKLSFVNKDSLEKIVRSPKYKDSVINAPKKFKFSHIISGNKYVYKRDSARFSSSLETPSLLALMNISFNTVDGVNIAFPFKYNLRDTTGKMFEAYSKFNYAFAREAISFDSHLHYLFNGRKMSFIQLSGGISSKDFKGDSPESSMENVYYSLYAEKNFKKFYESKSMSFIYSREISNGFTVLAQLAYDNRLALVNNSNLKFINVKNREYTENIMDNESILAWQYRQSERHSLALQLEYTPGQFYRYTKNVKSYVRSDYPSFFLVCSKAFTTFGGDADFDYLETGIKQSLSLFNNSLSYNLKAGKYLSSAKLYAQDLNYFKSSIEHISLSDDFTKFKSLAYYEPLSKDYFMEAHAKYSMSRFLLKRLPFFNDKLLMQESLFVSYLNTESLNHYFELGYGLNNIFALIKTEIVAGFREGEMDYLGFKLNIKLNQH